MEKLKMHIWSTTPALAGNIEELQNKINELIKEVNLLNGALEEVKKRE